MKSRIRASIPIAGAVALAITLGACSSVGSSAGSSAGSPTASSDPNATVTVWTDTTREPGFQAFQKAHPNIKLNIQPIPATEADVFAKLQLDNRVGSGWPDVIFDSDPIDVATYADSQLNYAEPLQNLVPATVTSQYDQANAPCMIGGSLYCLRNDVAQTVLWYNSKLMAKWGYTVPQTWAQFEALGKTVATQHPGTVLGAVGDAGSIYYPYFQAAGCPMQQVIAPNKVNINLSAPACTTIAGMLDAMVANKTLLTSASTDPATITAAKAGKILMMPTASWFGQFIFGSPTLYNFANGTLAAALSPGLTLGQNESGMYGGGFYVVSRHAKNLAGAVAVAQWMSTNQTFQSTSPTYPAYVPAAKAWSSVVEKSPLFASNPFPVLQEAATQVNPVDNSATRFDPATAITQVVIPAIRSGHTITSALPALQTLLTQMAQSDGYTVVHQ